jgi:GntR family transcriptional regulator
MGIGSGPVPMHQQLRELLRAEIRAGRFRPLDKLPSEAELSARHGISRVTVRQALGALQSDGLIFRVQGKGAYVSQAKARQDVTTLKGFDEAMAPLGHRTRNQPLSFDDVAADAETAARLGLAAGEPVCRIRRLRFLDDLPVSVDESYLPLDVGTGLRSKDLETRDIFLIIENDLSTPLGRANLAIEATTAGRDLARLLDVPAGAPVLRIERLTFSAAGRPIDFEYLFYRSDRFRYELSIERRPVPSEARP